VATNQVEQLWFSDDGSVVATIGDLEWLCGPIFTWRLDPKGKLIVNDGKQRHATLQKIAAEGDTVEVLRNGKPATYKRTKRD
jgi:hypothetical protein